MIEEKALAKINLFLHILGKREDGYHILESLVTFASVNDGLCLFPEEELSLEIYGGFGSQLLQEKDNLVIRAAKNFIEIFPNSKAGRFILTKNLPIASGIGGGSSDAAAALRLLSKLNNIPFDSPEIIRCAESLGADVPVCLFQKTRIMRGTGHEMEGILNSIPTSALLINPRIAVETRAIFKKLGLDNGIMVANETHTFPIKHPNKKNIYEILQETKNDLEKPAIEFAPIIKTLIDELKIQPECKFARMSGSGATIFGLFSSENAANKAASFFKNKYREFWIETCEISLPTN